MEELRCSCGKLLGKTEVIEDGIKVLEANRIPKPYIVKLWCKKCKKEVEFKL